MPVPPCAAGVPLCAAATLLPRPGPRAPQPSPHPPNHPPHRPSQVANIIWWLAFPFWLICVVMAVKICCTFSRLRKKLDAISPTSSPLGPPPPSGSGRGPLLASPLVPEGATVERAVVV